MLSDICSPLFWDICSLSQFCSSTKANFDSASIDDLKKICQQFFDMWYSLEGDIYSCSVRSYLRDLQINELAITISDLKDKFIKPSYENKLAKLQEKAAKFAFDNQLQLQINNLTISVSEREEKFIKPTLKKVFKYDNKFAKLHEKAAKFAFANQIQINELTVSLRDMKGKFIKPTLKKVSNLDSKYENNFAKLKILVSTFSLEK